MASPRKKVPPVQADNIVLARSRFFGPWAVRSAFVLAIFGWGVGFYGPSIYLAEVIGRTGWSLGLVSTAVTVHFLSARSSSPISLASMHASVCR
jgi:hypothetical protein